MTKLCYRVEADGCDAEDIEIIFAKSSIEAKRRWSNAHWNGDEIAGISARRVPGWDQYARTGVPAVVMIDDGWYFDCEGCSTRIGQEYIGTRDRHEREHEDYLLDDEYGSDLSIPLMHPVERPGQRVWCSQQCHDDDMAERALFKRYGERVKAWRCRRLIEQYPEVCPCEGLMENYSYPRSHVYVARRNGTLVVEQVVIHFSWPTSKIGLGTYRIDQQWHYGKDKPRRAELYVAGGDRAAFESWIAEQRGAKVAA